MSPDVEVRHSKYGGNGTFSTVRELIKYPGSFLESGRSISKSLITTPRYGQTRVRGGRVISRDRGEKFCISIELSVAVTRLPDPNFESPSFSVVPRSPRTPLELDPPCTVTRVRLV